MGSAGKKVRPATSWASRRVCLAVAVVGLALILAACSRGSYPFDLFPEMHYQQSYRIGEAPHRDAVPEAVPYVPSGVPISPLTVEEVIYPYDQYKGLANPINRGQADAQRAARLFQVNCAMCHGAEGRGDGPTAQFLTRWQSVPPANLTGPATQQATDGEVYSFITYGGRIGFVSASSGVVSASAMPQFRKLLSPEERWLLVHHLRQLQGK